MCRNRKNHPDHPSSKLKFFRGLRSFLIFNFVMIILLLTGNGITWFWKISAFWSIGLSITYIRAFGFPGADGLLSDEWDAWMEERVARKSSFSTKKSKLEWREKDLV